MIVNGANSVVSTIFGRNYLYGGKRKRMFSEKRERVLNKKRERLFSEKCERVLNEQRERVFSEKHERVLSERHERVICGMRSRMLFLIFLVCFGWVGNSVCAAPADYELVLFRIR